MMVENYYHKRDLQTIQTREVLAILYNANRGKLPSKTALELMPTFEEQQKRTKTINVVTPDPKELIKEVKKRYGG